MFQIWLLHHLFLSQKGRKQETTSQPSFFSQPQSFSSQQPGIQQTEQKQASKTSHTETPVSAEKPRKQTKSALHQEVSEFNPTSQMSTEKLIKAMLNLQKEVRKLKKVNEKLMESNEKLMENLNKQEEIDSRFMSQKRDKHVLEHISESKQLILKLAIEANRTGQRILKNRREIVNFQERVKRNWNNTGNRSSRRAKKRREIIKNKKEMFLLRKHMTLLSQITIGSIGNSNRNKEIIGFKKNRKKKEVDRMKRMFYNQNGSIYKIKIGQINSRNKVKGRKTWRNPNSQSRQHWTFQTFLFNSREHELLTS